MSDIGIDFSDEGIKKFLNAMESVFLYAWCDLFTEDIKKISVHNLSFFNRTIKWGTPEGYAIMNRTFKKFGDNYMFLPENSKKILFYLYGI